MEAESIVVAIYKYVDTMIYIMIILLYKTFEIAI